MFVLKKTPLFSTLEYTAQSKSPVPPYSEKCPDIVQGLLMNGSYFCGSKLFRKPDTERAHRALLPLIEHLLSLYDPNCDEFVDFDKHSWDVVRTPRINPGKHNIHFDPFVSEQHHALAAMARDARLEELLTRYQVESELRFRTEGGDGSTVSPRCCSLRECGLSLTAPKHLVTTTSESCRGSGDDSMNKLPAFGSGMELHSDGPRGENTVLMSFEDISFEQGPLLVCPGSHDDYVDGTGHQPDHLTAVENSIFKRNEKGGIRGRTVYHYSYRAGQPMVIDARTLHGALTNHSNKWRVICWYIFEYV